jgi:hypothetical protein
MKRTPILLIAFFGLAACGDDKKAGNNGGDAGGQNDAPEQMIDAAIDAPPAPAMITLTGTATERQLTMTLKVVGATIEAFENSNETTPLATATTNAQGNFTLVVNTGGVALNGFLKAKKAGLKDTYLYPTGFINSDLSMIPIQMISDSSLVLLNAACGDTQQATNALIALQVLDGTALTSKPVAGATVTSTPAGTSVHYTMNGTPSQTATVTGTDGVAFIFNVPANKNVVVNATKTGSTFASHNLKSWPDALTTTLITP